MLSLHQLTRRYGDTAVVDDISFEVQPGRMTGFVGADGAGKTTTMKMIVGVLGATSGHIYWHGEPITTEQRRAIGYMPEERGLYPKMKFQDQLVYFGRLHGMSATEASARADVLLGRLGLGERSTEVLEKLSWATNSASRSLVRSCTTRPRSCCARRISPRRRERLPRSTPPPSSASVRPWRGTSSLIDVAYYARQLGYSPRTLTRASLAAAGIGAKEFLDRRVVLEAKRLLAHSDDPVAAIAAELGFPDASNFVKYFALRADATPATFRQQFRTGSA